VCKLKQSIYELKQASRVWNRKLHEYITRIGFKRSNADHCLYINEARHIYITIWVDDILIAGNGKEIAIVKKQLAVEFEIKDLGEMKHFLGMRITRSDDGIAIDQTMYIRHILERFGMSNSKPVSTPIAAGTRIIKADDSEIKLADLKYFQAIVASAMWAMLCIRPDIASAVQQLSQVIAKPTETHLQVAKRVLRYLQGT